MVRTGIGYDVHRLVEGKMLILGGIHIPSSIGLAGHSDADVLLHAITDALLGSVALGDIGAHYPDTDPDLKGARSAVFLGGAAKLVHDAGYTICNVDATVVLQSPKLRPYVAKMQENIASILGIDMDRVSVKATTTEGLGFVGTGAGASALAVCTVETDPS